MGTDTEAQCVLVVRAPPALEPFRARKPLASMLVPLTLDSRSREQDASTYCTSTSTKGIIPSEWTKPSNQTLDKWGLADWNKLGITGENE